MKHRINNNGTITEFDSLAEHDAAVNAISPTDVTRWLQFEKAEFIGKELVRDLWRTLKDQGLTDAQEGDLLNRIFPVLTCLSDGFIGGARTICNNIPIAGQFTTGRKNYLLGKIDEAITQI